MNISIGEKKVFGSAAPRYKRLKDYRRCRGVTRSLQQNTNLLLSFALLLRQPMLPTVASAPPLMDLSLPPLQCISGLGNSPTGTILAPHCKKSL